MRICDVRWGRPGSHMCDGILMRERWLAEWTRWYFRVKINALRAEETAYGVRARCIDGRRDGFLFSQSQGCTTNEGLPEQRESVWVDLISRQECDLIIVKRGHSPYCASCPVRLHIWIRISPHFIPCSIYLEHVTCVRLSYKSIPI